MMSLDRFFLCAKRSSFLPDLFLQSDVLLNALSPCAQDMKKALVDKFKPAAAHRSKADKSIKAFARAIKKISKGDPVAERNELPEYIQVALNVLI